MNDLQSYLPYLVGVLLPLVVGLSTRATTPNAVKAVLHVVLAIVVGPLLAWQAAKFSSGFDISAAVASSAAVWGTGVLAHFGFLKPTGVSTVVSGLVNASDPTFQVTPAGSPPASAGSQDIHVAEGTVE